MLTYLYTCVPHTHLTVIIKQYWSKKQTSNPESFGSLHQTCVNYIYKGGTEQENKHLWALLKTASLISRV